MKAEETCEKIVKTLVSQGYRYQIPHKDLVKAIMTLRGIDERTIERWINALITFEYIERLTTETFKIYKLNPLRIPELMTLLKEEPQTKLQ